MSKKLRSKRAVILLSGGIDSATLLYWAIRRNYEPVVLIFDYNQRHKKEVSCAKKIASSMHLKYLKVKIGLSWAQSSLTNKKINVLTKRNLKSKNIPNTYVSGRNIVFLSYAFSLAESIGAKHVLIGAHVQDYSGYPDCRPEFLKRIETAMNYGMKESIKILAPFVEMSKEDIIRIGLKLGVPYEYTWSCYSGTKRPCEKCDSCRFRSKAFKKIGINDPAL